MSRGACKPVDPAASWLTRPVLDGYGKVYPSRRCLMVVWPYLRGVDLLLTIVSPKLNTIPSDTANMVDIAQQEREINSHAAISGNARGQSDSSAYIPP